MKVEELFKTIEPMVEQVDKGTALFMLGCDDEKECVAIKGKATELKSIFFARFKQFI